MALSKKTSQEIDSNTQDLPSIDTVRRAGHTGGNLEGDSRLFNSVGWLMAVAVPLLLWLIWIYIPMPGALIAALAVCGGFAGYLLYEHSRVQRHVSSKTVVEQLLLALLLLAAFTLIV